jgi:hypothetical protein
MKKLLFLFVLFISFYSVHSQYNRSFFISETGTLKPDLPYPGEISGHSFGEWHFSHDQLIHYLKQLSEQSERISMWKYGKTHENRPLYLLAVTSPDNQGNLEEIRKNHLEAVNNPETDAEKNNPLVVWLGYGVHGNESSPGNASMLVAYYLAASQSQEVQEVLNSSVILIDPCLNPDGFNRAATWSNMHTHKTIVSNPADRQFREDWPGGRTNHYWFDLNRDWLPLQHPESQARIEQFHKWKPHVLTDHHEMGSSSTFFFQPGVPERVNPLTPDRNFELTKEISEFHADALDKIGSLYFSEEGFDDFYYGKGSTYPDVNGSIGILFEQSRVLGQVIENPHGKLSFAEAIRNHFTVSLSTIKASIKKEQELKDYLQDFYVSAEKKAEEEEVKGYVFSKKHDPVSVYHFLKMLTNHNIEAYSLKSPMNLQGRHFSPENSYLVPLKQDQYRLIKSLFEKRTEFEDSIFYDISTWTMPLAFDLDYATVNSRSELEDAKGEEVGEVEMPEGSMIGGQSDIGYLARGENYNIHAFLYQLKKNGLIAKVAGKSFTTEIGNTNYQFNNGTIFIPVNNQELGKDEIYSFLSDLAGEKGVDVYALNSALSSEGIDMGSWNFIPVRKPEILVAAGDGVSSYTAGEIWHLLDHRMNMEVVLAKPERLNRINLFEFNTLVLPDGRYDWGEDLAKKLEIWIEEGGVVVALEDANEWLKKHELITYEIKEKGKEETEAMLSYDSRRDRSRIQSVSGVILNSTIDPTHPLNYGINGSNLPVFKDNGLFVKKPDENYSAPLIIQENSLLSGFLSSANKKKIENTAWCMVKGKGRGQIVSFVDNPNFRAFWYGTNKVFMNALFYGRYIR